MNTTSEILNRAADHIERHGWWTQSGGGTGTCASNAIYHVTGDAFTPAHSALLVYLGHNPNDPTPIFRWNDAPGRAASEVIEVLRACALIEASREARDEQESAWATYAPNLAGVSS